jgi:predicted metal-dependent hydrolase
MATPTPDNHALIHHKVVQWYQKQAMTDFARRLTILATKLGVPTPPLTLSNAKSRWGSCNSRGEVRLNWRLLQASPSIINYVICHELAHLKQMNHSAKFWAVVESLFSDYKQAENALKTLSPQLHRI